MLDVYSIRLRFSPIHIFRPSHKSQPQNFSSLSFSDLDSNPQRLKKIKSAEEVLFFQPPYKPFPQKSFRNCFYTFTFFFLAQVSVAQAENLPFPIPSDPRQLPESALIETTKGPIEIEFYREVAPITVSNFVWLAKKGFYDKIFFHLYKPNFIVQGGDPRGTGEGGPGYTLPAEFSNLKHELGTVGMAKKHNQVNPERRSNGSQFYISLNRSKHLDGLYTVFGRVINGIENALRLRRGDRIISVRLPKTSPLGAQQFRKQEFKTKTSPRR